MSNSIVDPPSIIKHIPLLAIATTTVCFVLGLLIVNFRLSWYGIYATEFARTEYILVGAVFIFLVATAYASFAYSEDDFARVIPNIKVKRYLSAFGNTLAGIMTLTGPLIVIFGTLFFNSQYIFSWMAWFSILGLILIGHITHLFTEELAALIQEPRSIVEAAKTKRARAANRLLGQIAFVLIFIGYYAYFMYPHIPPAFGGGHKSPVMLYPTSRGLEVCKTLVLPLQSNLKIIGPIEILTEFDKELVVLIPDSLSGKQHALRLNKDLFEAIQVTAPKIQ